LNETLNESYSKQLNTNQANCNRKKTKDAEITKHSYLMQWKSKQILTSKTKELKLCAEIVNM